METLSEIEMISNESGKLILVNKPNGVYNVTKYLNFTDVK